MIIGKLIRYHFGLNATLGVLKLNIDHSPIYTLELPWRDNKTNISCIPKGSYIVSPYTSEKYPNVYEVTKVKDRSAILFHIGNYHTDTHGCIMVGTGVSPSTPMVTNSGIAINILRSLIKNNDFELTIENI